MNEEMKSGEGRKSYLLPVSILVAALIVGGAVVYTAGKGSNPNSNSGTDASRTASADVLTKVRPVSGSDHIYGDPNAPVKLIEFSDLECPFCKQFHVTLRQLSADYAGKFAWVFRNYPIPQLHPKAPHEAQAAECAAKLGGNDKYWQYVDKIFEITPSNNGLDPAELPKIAQEVGLPVSDFNSCLSSSYGQDIVQADEKDGTNAGAIGTPYSIVIDANGLPQATVTLLNSLNSQYGANPPLFVISKDQKMFSVGGAVPYTVMKQVFDTLIPSK